MNTHSKIAIGAIVVGLIVIGAARFILPQLEEQQERLSSDAKYTKGRISIGVDNFIGYFPLCSPDMKRRMRHVGYLLDCIEDNADYASRFENLEDGKLDFAVGTVDSYVLVGKKSDYPGVIVAVLDESKGGDALVSWSNDLGSLDDFRKVEQYKIAFTPDSPSHHLLKSIAVHFDIARIIKEKSWRIDSSGSEAALKSLLNKTANAAVLWEPDLSKALSTDGIVKILGTEKTQQLIVDVLIANRRFVENNREAAQQLLVSYFKTLKFYRKNNDELVKDVRAATKLSQEQIKNMLKGIEWQSYSDNSEKWFGLSASQDLPQEAVIDTIDSTIDVLIESESIKRNPLPNADPYWLTQSAVLKAIESRLVTTGFGESQSVAGDVEFEALSDAEWRSLREVGTLKIRPIVFASGTYDLTLEGKEQLDSAVQNLKHYPAFRILVKGHTGTRGDAAANKQLSQDRAESVLRYFEITHGISGNRINALGYGGSQPLPRKPGESLRAYNYRLPRVELVLLAEDI